MSYYVKMIGAHDLPLSNTPFEDRPELLDRVRFPRDQFPREMRRGDELIYYAVGGYKGIFAIAQLTADPERDVGEDIEPERLRRWPHAASVDFRVRLRFVDSGPALADVGRSLQGQVGQGVSHFEIGRPEFERAYDLLRKAKVAEDQKMRLGVRG